MPPINPAVLSNVSGYMSIALWVVVYSPQIWENYQLKSGEGLSVPFIILWLLGDITNLFGGMMAHLLPTVIILAVYVSHLHMTVFRLPAHLLESSILFVIWFCCSKFITIVASRHPALTSISHLMNPPLFSQNLASPSLFCLQLSNILYCLGSFCLLAPVLGFLPIGMKSTSPRIRK